MIKFDAEKFIREGEKVYNLRDKIEAIAIQLFNDGIKNIFFTASG